jgi:hypothetical protein
MHKTPYKSMFNRTFTLLAAGAYLFASLSAFAQYNPNIQQNVQPNAFSQTGYTNDGTLFMGGQRIGNPHQVLHDLNVPSFFGVNANRLSFSDVPSYGQGTLAQMENHTLTIGVPAGNVVLSRLYVTPTNPYTQGVATPHNNYQTYQGVVADAQAGSYQPTVANDNKLYVFKTLGAMSTQSQNILIKELPAHSVFIANSDPNGGAVAVRVTQSGDSVAMQNYLNTVKPYDFSWRSAFGPYANDPNTGAFVANWVMGSHQVQTYQANMQNKSMQTGNEGFGVLAWDANQNKYVMLDPTNTQATAGSVSGNMPTLGNNQFGFFGMHTHPGSATPSNQDNLMTQQLGLDQIVIGTNGNTVIMTNNPGNQWQGAGFEFEAPRTITVGYGASIYGIKGGGVQAGGYVSFDTEKRGFFTDGGYYGSIESGNGIGQMGHGPVIGYVFGDKSTLEGTAYNTNGSAILSGTRTTNANGEVTGYSLGTKTPIPGISSTESFTSATSLKSWFTNTFSGDSTSGTNSDGMGNTGGSSKD